MGVKEQHHKDVSNLAPKMAEAVKGVLAEQRKSVSAKSPSLDTPAEIAKTKSAVLPAMIASVGVGAKRVASVVGSTTPDPDTDLAGAWAYKFATQLTTTTQGQLDDLDDTADTDDVAGVFDARADLAMAMAWTAVSNAINSGAQNYAATLPAATQPTKTWELGDDHPCAACEAVDGETVPASTDFSNGAPHGPIHDGCMCSVDFSAQSTSRAARPPDFDRIVLVDADRLRLNLPPVRIP